MALPINLENLINKKTIESERIEFKKGWNPDEVIHTICAFANDMNNWGGGYIILGIDDQNGLPILPPEGLKETEIDSIQKRLAEFCHLILPNYSPIIEPVLYQGKWIIVLGVPGGDNRPYKAPLSVTSEQGRKEFFHWVRKGPTTQRATIEDEKRLMEIAAKVPFDDRINHNATLEDFKIEHIQKYLKDVKSELIKELSSLTIEQIVRKLNIARGPDEYLKPINVGLLMFSENPEVYFRGAEIQIIIYDNDIGDSFTEQSFKGPIHEQLRNALQFLRLNIIKSKTRKISGKAETLTFTNYPYNAIEEALANAVYHKSYEHDSCIEVNIRPDRLEILSLPGPLPPLDNDKLQRDRIIARDYRNRRIGDFLKELRLTEGRATGIPTIRHEMKENGSPDPGLETDAHNTYFLATLPIHPAFLEVELNEHQISILKYCSQPRSRKDILKSLGLTNHYENFKRYAVPLIQTGYLDLTLPEIPNSMKQEYVTNRSGKVKLSKQD